MSKSEDTVKYSVVKDNDLELAMKASVTSTVAGRKMEGADGIVWNQTVVSVMEGIDLSEVIRKTDKDSIKANGALIKKHLAEAILSKPGFSVPEEGKNRKGQTFRVCGKNGLPQWSSWDMTRRIWDYAGTIGKVLSFSLDSVLYPEAMKVGARCDVMKSCKVAEPHMDAIKRQATGLQNSLDQVANSSEAHTALASISTLSVNNLDLETELKSIVTALTAKLGVADNTQKGCIKSDLIALATKHFKNI